MATGFLECSCSPFHAFLPSAVLVGGGGGPVLHVYEQESVGPAELVAAAVSGRHVQLLHRSCISLLQFHVSAIVFCN